MDLRGLVVGDRILGVAADSHADWCAGYGRLGPLLVQAQSGNFIYATAGPETTHSRYAPLADG
jgi:hypothetical protein